MPQTRSQTRNPTRTPTRTLAAAGYVALALADTLLAGRSGKAARRLRFLTKPLLMPVLATAFLDETQRRRNAHSQRETRGRRDVLRQGAVAAQAFSWGGDLALLGAGQRSFLAGLGSFFAAHISYLAAFASVRRRPSQAGDAETPSGTGLRVAVRLAVVTAPVMAVAAGRKDPAMRGPVAAYGGILAAMFASSSMLDPALPAGARRMILIGTSLFLVSDTTLGVREFLLVEPSPRLEQVVMATYTAAQGLIAAGVAQATV